MNKNRIVFVTGIPRGTIALEVIRIFSEIGYKIKVVNQYSENIESSSRINSGYCLMKTESVSDYSSILELHHVFFSGRRLILKPYLTGTDLYKQNRKNNKRRILIKQVPFYISETEIRNHLENRYGFISELYRLKPHQPSSSYSRRKFCAYSVMFEEAIADHFKSSTFLEIRTNTFVIAERFCLNKKQNPCSSESSSRLSPELHVYDFTGGFTTKVDLETHVNLTETNLPLYIHNYHRLSPRSQRAPSESSPSVERRRKSRPCSATNRRRPSTGYQKIVFSTLLLNSSHHLKPNSKIYRLLRDHDPEFLGTFALKDSWIALSNLRENKLVSQTGQDGRKIVLPQLAYRTSH